MYKSDAGKNRQLLNEKMGYPYNIALIGFMGAGKSTAARYLSKLLELEQKETDEMIVRREGMAITDIFEKYGEDYFRNAESEIVKSLQNCEQSVISCGGGLVMREENVHNLKISSRIVLLTAKPATILARVKNSTARPILNGHMNEEYIGALMEKRREKYEQAADLCVETDNRSIEQICEAIVNGLCALRSCK